MKSSNLKFRIKFGSFRSQTKYIICKTKLFHEIGDMVSILPWAYNRGHMFDTVLPVTKISMSMFNAFIFAFILQNKITICETIMNIFM